MLLYHCASQYVQRITMHHLLIEFAMWEGAAQHRQYHTMRMIVQTFAWQPVLWDILQILSQADASYTAVSTTLPTLLLENALKHVLVDTFVHLSLEPALKFALLDISAIVLQWIVPNIAPTAMETVWRGHATTPALLLILQIQPFLFAFLSAPQVYLPIISRKVVSLL